MHTVPSLNKHLCLLHELLLLSEVA